MPRSSAGESSQKICAAFASYVWPLRRGRRIVRLGKNRRDQSVGDFLLAMDLIFVDRGWRFVLRFVNDSACDPVTATALQELLHVLGDRIGDFGMFIGQAL